MSASRRRLLYADGNLTFNGNITIECADNCVGVCVYGFCFPSPLLSPTPLPYGDISGDGTSAIKLRSSNRIFSTLIITATAAVAGSFLLLLALYGYLRFRRRRRRPRSADRAVSASDGGDDLFQGGGIEHHIWHIRTQGLDESTISSIASLLYRSGDGVVDGRDCSVCLGEFRDGELVRLLPKCKHAFHLPCIDRWLGSHVSCPLCRAPIVPSSVAPVSPASPRDTGNYAPARQLIGSSVLAESSEDGRVLWEVGGRKGSIQMGMEIQPSEGSSSGTCTWELSHSLQPGEAEGWQPIRRSISMDSFALDALAMGAGKERNESESPREEDEHAGADRGTPVGNVRNNWRLKVNQPEKKMERCLSSQSARWFFSRNCRARNWVLPL